MTLGGHESKGLLVSVEDKDPGGEFDATYGEVKEGDVTRTNSSEGTGESVALGPELREMRLPGRDDLLWGRRRPELGRVGLLSHLSESLGEPTAQMLSAGAVIGDDFDADLLRSVSGRGESEIEAALEAALREPYWLRSRPTSPTDLPDMTSPMTLSDA